MTKKKLLYSTGNPTQYFVIIYLETELKRVDICVCITDSLCCMAEMNTTL